MTITTYIDQLNRKFKLKSMIHQFQTSTHFRDFHGPSSDGHFSTERPHGWWIPHHHHRTALYSRSSTVVGTRPVVWLYLKVRGGIVLYISSPNPFLLNKLSQKKVGELLKIDWSIKWKPIDKASYNSHLSNLSISFNWLTDYSLCFALLALAPRLLFSLRRWKTHKLTVSWGCLHSFLVMWRKTVICSSFIEATHPSNPSNHWKQTSGNQISIMSIKDLWQFTYKTV